MPILARFWFSGMSGFCLLLTPVSTAQNKPAPAPIVIAHATVINPGTSSVQANRTVVITGDHITSVSDAAKFQLPKNARRSEEHTSELQSLRHLVCRLLL